MLTGGVQQPIAWHDLMSNLRDRLTEGVRFLLSAHASHEEMFLFSRLAQALAANRAPRDLIDVGWTFTPKVQPPGTTFKVPPVDAPNVNGARMLGLIAGSVEDSQGEADLSALRSAVQAGQVPALYVFDPGPAGSLGDTSWIVEARANGRLPLLIVQGVVLTELARAADFVLPGASYVEKEASYTNGQGRLQGAARAIPAPGEAMEDWQILVNLSLALGVPLEYASPAQIRADIAGRYGSVKGFEGITTMAFGAPVTAKHWLQASNPSERWKWDFMFQDLPPVKGTVDQSALPGVIPLTEVK
jgi:anaerobic selenocysteine-containing dehydrogenase